MEFSLASFLIGVVIGIIAMFSFAVYLGYRMNKKRGVTRPKKSTTKYEILVALAATERDLQKKKDLFLRDIEFELGKIEKQRKAIAETSGTTIDREELLGNTD